MSASIRIAIASVALLVCGWIGWNTYNYFFDQTQPTISLTGLEQDGYYAGELNAHIIAEHPYKVAHLSVWLDGKHLSSDTRASGKHVDRPLKMPTETLANGKHHIKVEVISGARHKQSAAYETDFYVDNTPLHVAFINVDHEHKIFQGRTLHLQFQANKQVKSATVTALSKEFPCFPESDKSTIYECFIPTSCEENPNEYPFVLSVEDHVGHRTTLDGKFQVMPFPFKKQVLHTIKTEHVEREKQLGKSNEELQQLLERATAESPRQKLWRGAFYVPCNMTAMTCEFGAKRISQEKGCYTHAAVDIIGLPKCVVWADADGIIVCKDRFGGSGNTVVIDHGWGILTLVCHLDSFADINVGQFIKRGSPVGRQGKTGYAGGEHVHWEIIVGGVKVDPMQWTKADF